MDYVTCLQCRNGRQRLDEFMDLSLDVADCDSLEAALRKFVQSETLTGDNRWRCDVCLSGDHRVLTRRGWRGITEVQVGDEVLSFNIDTYSQEWQVVTGVTSHAVNRRKEEDQMYRMQGSGMDVIATRDHRMLTTRLSRRSEDGLQKEKRVDYETVAELLDQLQCASSNRSEITRFERHTQSRGVVCTGLNRQPAAKVVIPGLERVCDWWWEKDEQLGFLQFLGFWLGDGKLAVNAGSVCISQKEEKGKQWLEQLLAAVFPRWWRRTAELTRPDYVVYTIRCPPLYNYLCVMAAGPLGYNPRDPAELRSYPHFTQDEGLAAVEEQSAYRSALNTAGYVSRWTEAEMLAAFIAADPERSWWCDGAQSEEEEEEQVEEEEVADDVEVARSPHGESVDDPAVAKDMQVAGQILWRNAGLWILINGHWFHLKRWLGDEQQIANVYSQLSRQQAIALLDGFCRADDQWVSIEYDNDGEPTGEWRCSSSSFPLIDHLQLIGQLAGAAVDLRLASKAGATSAIKARTATFTVDRWALRFTFTKSTGGLPFQTAPLGQPVDVSNDVDGRGYYDYQDDGRVHCLTVDHNANFLTQRLSNKRTQSGNISVQAHPLFIGNCAEKVEAKKGLTFHKLPPILTIQLKVPHTTSAAAQHLPSRPAE